MPEANQNTTCPEVRRMNDVEVALAEVVFCICRGVSKYHLGIRVRYRELKIK